MSNPEMTEKNQRIFDLAQHIHELLCKHAEQFSESEATCVIRIAHNLWAQAPTVGDQVHEPASVAR